MLSFCWTVVGLFACISTKQRNDAAWIDFLDILAQFYNLSNYRPSTVRLQLSKKIEIYIHIERVMHQICYWVVLCDFWASQRWLSSAKKKLSQLKSHVTPYKLECTHWWKIHLSKKNPLQDLLSSLKAVISTNERSWIYKGTHDL